MRKQLVVFAGPIASGKSTATNFLTETYDATAFATSTVLIEEAKKRGLPIDKSSLQTLFADWTLETNDEAILMKRLGPAVVASASTIVVVEGCRRLTDLRGVILMAEASGRDINLFYLDAPAHVRYDRLVARAKSGSEPMSREEFRCGEQSKSEKQLGQLRVAFMSKGATCIATHAKSEKAMCDIIQTKVETLVTSHHKTKASA